MDLQIVEKGGSLNLDIASKTKSGEFYFGAGWDNPNGPVDLDIVAVLLSGGKLTNQSNLIYFGNRSAAGVQLSEDNTTGEGEGDDESIVFKTAGLASDVDSIVIGLAAYAGADFSSAPNPHFRACDGSVETSAQVADVKAGSGASGDTVLVAFKLDKTSDGWVLTNVGDFHNKGNGKAAIEGFAGLYS
jgi:stress response protein SCP2